LKRIIIYGMGQIFHRYQNKIDWNEIIAIVDKKLESNSEFRGAQLILPKQINQYIYDYIAIFSSKFFEEIKCELKGNYFIQEEKIISWKALILEECTDRQVIEYYRKIIAEFQFHKILDIGMPFFPKYFFSREEILSNYLIQMDGIGNETDLIGKNLYQNILQNIEYIDCSYEIALMWDEHNRLEENILKLKEKVRYVLVHASYSCEIIQKIDKIIDKYPIKKRMAMSDIVFWLIDLSPKVILEDISIFVVLHKPYQVQCDEMYCPICVGNTYRKEGYISEDTGDNISYLNEKINECTALYWIWKNTNTKYVGLNHYRRYFYNNGIHNSGNYLDKETVYNFLQEYDIILGITEPLYEKTVLEQIMEPMNLEICMKTLKIIREALQIYQPNYADIFEHVVYGHKFHLCHMFVTSREILNQYCKWLFSFLIEVAEKINVENYDPVNRRVVGFFAERMLTTWLLKQNLKIKELPFVMIK